MEETEFVQGKDMTDLIFKPSRESQRYVQYGKARDIDVVPLGSIENSKFKDRYLEMVAQ